MVAELGGTRIPEQWSQAQAALAGQGGSERVWLLPGDSGGGYRWEPPGRPRGAGDLVLGLLGPTAVVRQAPPVGSPYAANLLAAVDDAVQDGRTSPGQLSAAARYLAAGTVVVRNDLRWEATGLARPATVVGQVETDPGLVPGAVYGAPGADTTQPGRPARDAASQREQSLAPVITYAVAAPTAVVSTSSLSGHVLVVGDNQGAVRLMGAGGGLDGRVPYDLVASLTAEQVGRLLDQGARVVLTDTNLRRTADDRAVDRYGPLLPVDRDPGPTRALFTVSDQTVATDSGARLPLTLTRLAAGDARLRTALSRVPVDVSLRRLPTEGPGPWVRQVSVPGRGTFRVEGIVDVGRADQPSTAADARCRRVGSLDGRSVRARVEGSTLRGCGRLQVGAGERVVRVDGGRTGVVDLDLVDTRSRDTDGPGGSPDVVWSSAAGAYTAKVAASQSSYLLVVHDGDGQGWRAVSGGTDLGAPALVDGQAMGWWLPPGAERSVEVTYAPQARYQQALGLSLAAVVAFAVLALVSAAARSAAGVGARIRGRRREPPRAAAPPGA